MNYKIAFLLVYLFFAGDVSSQRSEEFNRYSVKFPNESLVSIERENVITIGIKNNELVISESKYSKKIYLNQSAKYYSEEKIYSSDFSPLDEISASSFNFIGGKYKRFKVSDFSKKDERSGSVFYDDVKSVNFYYAGLETGSKTELRWEKTIKNPRFFIL